MGLLKIKPAEINLSQFAVLDAAAAKKLLGVTEKE